MAQVLVKVLTGKEVQFYEQTGKDPKNPIQKIDKKIADILINNDIVELAPLQRELEGHKQEIIETDFSKNNLDLLKNEQLLDLLVREVNKIGVGEEKSIKTILLVCSLAKVKNKMSTSANLCLNAQSGTGKDFITATTLSLLPSKLVFKRRRISQRALDYALAMHQSRDWSNYIIYLEDVSEGVLNADSIKTLLTASTDSINTTTIVHEGAVKDLNIKGKPIFIFTTAKSKPKEETLRRVPFCFMDESSEQTLKITEKQAEEALTGKITKINTDVQKFFSGLKNVSVIIPFASNVQKKLASNWISENKRYQVILRTIFPRFLDYIKASAALYQYQRKSDDEFIYAQKEDYDNARLALLSTTSNKMLIPLNREQKILIQVLENNFPEGGTIQKIEEKFSKWEERWLRIQLDKLTDLGFVEKEMINVDFSKKAVGFYKVEKGVLEFSMPSWEDLFNDNNVQNNTIDTNDSVNTINTINANKENNHQNNTIDTNVEQVHQLHSDFEHRNAQNCTKFEKVVVE